jgi:hypothetical protein
MQPKNNFDIRILQERESLVHIVSVRKEKKTERMAARLTPTAKGLMNAISQKMGVSDGDVLEIVLRDYAERHGIKPVYWDDPAQVEES